VATRYDWDCLRKYLPRHEMAHRLEKALIWDGLAVMAIAFVFLIVVIT